MRASPEASRSVDPKWAAFYNVADRSEEATIKSLAPGQAPGGKITEVSMLGNTGNLSWTQEADGLKAKLPKAAPGHHAYALKISGLQMNASTRTPSANPQ